MELEKLKAALQERKFEGYLFERPAQQIVLDVQRRARNLEEKEKAHDIQAVIGGLALAALYFVWFDSRQPWWSNAGIALMVAGTVLVAACTLSLYLPGRRIRFDLPREEFLVQERKRLRARIRILHREGLWAWAPLIAGMLIYFASLIKSVVAFAVCVLILVIGCGAAWWFSTRRHGKALQSLLDEIELELAQLRTSKP